MQYIQVQFNCDPNTEVLTDVLSARLGEIGFESFVRTETGLDAYIPLPYLSPEKVDQLLSDFPLDAGITYSCYEMEDKNWNEEWEKNYFQPVVIDDVLCIHSSFHKIEDECRYRILIDPKMSFGTGHHQTTELMMRELLNMDLQGKSLLDMGCGTAVLAILASMRGASPITAIDIDEWAYQNAMENTRLNGIDNIRLFQGGAELLGDETYDVILANINRNILLQDMPVYRKVLNRDGVLVMSGFYKEDIPHIRVAAEGQGLIYGHFSELDQWVAVTFCYQ
ncbi:MAG: 50S ribosomal protein L11 methyltransferase [Proteiniphilum sp.]|jgi:ribosomal protein L11 methyltransferase|uniref:50S ribosomal protein L11 methyltransferase n=1 Tax=Proteiniphilum sp. TaxID=1926877 RepID=UPI002B1F10AD|nr:50S ribosomal protein L11 methyltransferase [Proteiniphilum sp.]MEA5129724.1 50S ribosomal protein L11 methyltransferase [Proteiniphilum sp.]